MKKILLPLIAFLFIAITFTSCLEDKCDASTEFVRFDPVYLTLSQIRTDVTLEAPRALEEPGRLYLYKDYLFINEQAHGIHIYDNSDPSNPVDIGFYGIVGNFDLSIKDDILYADNVLDIISIDISNIQSPVIVHREENAFEMYDWNGTYLSYYNKTDIVEVLDCNDDAFGAETFWRGDVLFANEAAVVDVDVLSSGSEGSNVGTGGSTARFTIVGDYLYNVDQSNLMTWSIGNGFSRVNTQNIGWGIETIFPYESHLFIGSETGMHIYDNSNPELLVHLSTFQHARACDPVVVEGNTAYVTLRNGSACESFINQLDVIDITSLTNPTLIKTYPMSNPHGLSVRDNTLYICEGDFGLKIFDASDSEKIDRNLLADVSSIKSTDVIALPDDRLLVIGSEGFYQYDVTNVESPQLLSLILVENQ
jgi:hypothetical protein